MCGNKTFLDNEVSYDVLKDANGVPPTPQDLIAYESLAKVLIPYEVKITKAKEGVKDKKRYMLFCTENLRIYDSVEQYVNDRRQLQANTRELENQIMQMNTISSMPAKNSPSCLLLLIFAAANSACLSQKGIRGKYGALPTLANLV